MSCRNAADNRNRGRTSSALESCGAAATLINPAGAEQTDGSGRAGLPMPISPNWNLPGNPNFGRTAAPANR
jgi:hypothetical protein